MHSIDVVGLNGRDCCGGAVVVEPDDVDGIRDFVANVKENVVGGVLRLDAMIDGLATKGLVESRLRGRHDVVAFGSHFS